LALKAIFISNTLRLHQIAVFVNNVSLFHVGINNSILTVASSSIDLH